MNRHYNIYIPFLMVFVTTILGCSKTQNQESKENKIKNDSLKISLNHLTNFTTGDSKVSSAEIVSYDPYSKRLFVANSIGKKIDILDINDPVKIKFIKSIDISKYGNSVNSISVKNKIVAAAIENHDRQKEGFVCFFSIDGFFFKQVQVGVIPDMLTYTPDGSKILVANEGEPNDEYTIDPEGSISIIDISSGISELSQKNVTQVNFKNYNDSLQALRSRGIRIFGPNATVAQDLEPENIAVSSDSKFAYITLQENNAVALLNIEEKKINNIFSLGDKPMKLNVPENPSLVCPLKGLHQPDGITFYTSNNEAYLITANEGDVRLYEGFKENKKLGDKEYSLDPKKFPEADKIKKDDAGKLFVPGNMGDIDGDGDIDEIYCYGSRSFSIWDLNLKKLYDSEDDFMKITCNDSSSFCKFNERYDASLRKKIDNRGPEPETVVTAKINNESYAFITLERYGGVMVYNISTPKAPYFMQYINSNLTKGKEDYSKPEGIIFIPSKDSPSKKDLIVVANEGNSSIDVYQVDGK